MLGSLVLPLLLGACDRANMAAQDKSQTWDENQFFPDKSTMRQPVPGTVARDAPNVPVAQPAVITAALVARGHERFDIFCSPCHGLSGDGKGMIVQRGFPGAATLVPAAARTGQGELPLRRHHQRPRRHV